MSRTAVVIPVSLESKPYLTTVEDNCTSYYQIIGCRAFDIVELSCKDNKTVDCFVDDEGMLNGSPVNEFWMRAYSKKLANFPLFGITVITMTDIDTGESIDTDIEQVKQTLKKYGFSDQELTF